MNGKEGITEFVRVRYNLPLQKDAEVFEKDTEVLKKDTDDKVQSFYLNRAK